MSFRDSPTKAFLRCNHGKEILHLDWENQGSFFSDPCLGFLQSCMLRLVLNWFAIFRQLDEKHKPGLKIENWLPWTRGQRKQRGRRVQAVCLMASVISMVEGGTQGVCEVNVDYVILGNFSPYPGALGVTADGLFCLGGRGR